MVKSEKLSLNVIIRVDCEGVATQKRPVTIANVERLWVRIPAPNTRWTLPMLKGVVSLKAKGLSTECN